MTHDEITAGKLLVLSLEGKKSSPSDGELLYIYDAAGEVVGCAPRYLCHTLGLAHRVALCYLIGPGRDLLLQSRGDGRLDVAVAGHMSVEDENSSGLVMREAAEELGLELKEKSLELIATYRRVGPIRVERSHERNVEIRDLFVYRLTPDEIDKISEGFQQRTEKENVTGLAWFTVSEVLTACSLGKAADGLIDTLGWYLDWTNRS